MGGGSERYQNPVSFVKRVTNEHWCFASKIHGCLPTEINYLDKWHTYVCSNANLSLHLLTFMLVAMISFEGSARHILIGHMAYYILRLRMWTEVTSTCSKAVILTLSYDDPNAFRKRGFSTNLSPCSIRMTE